LSRLAATPQLPLVLLFLVWCLITVAANQPEGVVGRAQALIIPASLYLLIAHTLQTFRGLEVTVGLLSAIGIFLAVVGVHQGLSSWGCHQLAYKNGEPVEIYDGRECSPDARRTCDAEGSEPGADYNCELVGLFGTQSVFGRVRFRGTL